MGVYDRDYYREETPGIRLRGPRTAIGWIVLINVVVFLVDNLVGELFFPAGKNALHPAGKNPLHYWLACRPETLYQPWLWWEFLTYGFTHATMSQDPGHIIFNMLTLWFLGPPVEQRYGSREFLRFYLAAIVVCGALGSAAGLIGASAAASLVGASGGVVAVVMLFIVNFPRQTILLFFVLPVPAWLLGVILVVMNLLGSAGYQDPNVAYGVHLVGVGFAAAYYYFHWNLGRLTERISLDRLGRGRNLHIHRPDDDGPDDKLNVEVDRILQKIHEHGEASLSRKERRTLETASRRYQKNRRS